MPKPIAVEVVLSEPEREQLVSWSRQRRVRRRSRCARGSCWPRVRGEANPDRPADGDARPRSGSGVSGSSPTGWTVSSTSRARDRPDDHRRAGRTGDHHDIGGHAEERDALVDAVDGPEVGLSQSAVYRIWRASPAPHRQDTWKLSKDPQFIEKVRDVVGLYLNPPERAVVLCVDEKSQIQALDRTAPILPMLPGMPERATHDYGRAGTSSLYAALDITTGQVIGRCTTVTARSSSRSSCDDRPRGPHDSTSIWCSTTLHPQDAGDQELARRASALRPALHPDRSSWLNLVERWFAELTTKKLKRGAHRSVRALNTDIRAWIETWNDDPKPFVWTKTADQILDSITRYCTRINESRH